MSFELSIVSEGARMWHANYWASAQAAQGQCFVARHQDTWHMLVPPTSMFNMAKAGRAHHVRIQRCRLVKGLWSLFFDETAEWRDDSYVYWLGKDRFAPALKAGQRGTLEIWVPGGRVMRLAARAID